MTCFLDFSSRGSFSFPTRWPAEPSVAGFSYFEGRNPAKTVDERFLINRDNLKKIIIIDVCLKILCRDFSTLQCKPAPLPPPLLGGHSMNSTVSSQSGRQSLTFSPLVICRQNTGERLHCFQRGNADSKLPAVVLEKSPLALKSAPRWVS